MVYVEWSLMLASLVGVILNIRKHRGCFFIWAGTNFGWTILDYRAGLYGQATLFTIYFFLALWGIWEWRHKKEAHGES
jgi:nicotinamide riboside transporter PnuC